MIGIEKGGRSEELGGGEGEEVDASFDHGGMDSMEVGDGGAGAEELGDVVRLMGRGGGGEEEERSPALR